MRTPEEQKAYAKQWYENNRVKHREYYQKWYAKNREKQCAYSKNYYHNVVKNRLDTKREKRKYNKIDVNELKVQRGEFILTFQ